MERGRGRSLCWKLNVTAVDGIWMDVEEVRGSWVTKYLHIIGAPQPLPGPTLYSTAHGILRIIRQVTQELLAAKLDALAENERKIE